MATTPWSEILESLAAAIGAALPLQLAKAKGERIAGVGLDMDAYYGSAGLYLLPESAARKLGVTAANSLTWIIHCLETKWPSIAS
jgi:hypothetical protein